jgi:hypothetical protein
MSTSNNGMGGQAGLRSAPGLSQSQPAGQDLRHGHLDLVPPQCVDAGTSYAPALGPCSAHSSCHTAWQVM